MFFNKYLKEYILSERNVGKCDYCNSNGVNIISTGEIGAYIRECLKKAYEDIENGTGAYWDSEEKQYCNRTGRSVAPYSIRDIFSRRRKCFKRGCYRYDYIGRYIFRFRVKF